MGSIILANLAGFGVAITLYLIMKRTSAMREKPDMAVPILAFATGAVLASTVLGNWSANLASNLGAWALAFGAASVVIGFYIFADLKDGKMDSKWTGVGLVAFPLICMAGAGAFPDLMNSLNTNAGGGLVAMIAPMIGG